MLLLVVLYLACSAASASRCTYSTYTWNTVDKAAVNFQTVDKSYAEIAPEEIDPNTGCTVCREDQRTIDIPPLKPFKVCRVLAPRIEAVLRTLIRDGQPIDTITAYRVGKTRGDADAKGNRTRFSNHSFGIALDINAAHNGLYDRCFEFGPNCRLIQGGPWNPDEPGSLTEEGDVVRLLQSIGFKWGGRIGGRQKDFMHFSPTGY